MILEPAKKKRPSEDDSFIGIRVGVLLLVALALFGVLAFRLWFLQILSGDEYSGSATGNRVRTVMVEAPRGVIYDRKGKPLVENRAGLTVGLLAMDVWDPEEDTEEFFTEMTRLADVLDMPLAEVLAAYDRAEKDPYVTHAVKEDVPEDTVVAYLREHSEDFRGVVVEKTFLRQYPSKSLAAHLLGYVGEISKTDLDQTEFTDLKAGAHIGKDGVERTYDSYLRGTDGWKTVEVDASGKPLDFIEEVDAGAGFNLWLTIDSKLQTAAERAILEGIERAHRDGLTDAAEGAVVALDPRSGEVLALASYPNYDPSVFVGGIDQTVLDALNAPEAHYPLFDRAISGLYPAASTFKPFVACVAQDAGVVSAGTIFNCTGRFSRQKQTWRCWNYDGHGDLNLIAALAQSCDVYFYNLGELLYKETGPVLQDGLRKFGFGRQSGIDLPGETTGTRVPDKDWKRLTGKTAEEQAWKTGDEINLAIGQGDLLVTPIQLAVALSAIANGGTVWVPHLGLQITDAAGTVVNPLKNEKRGELGMSADILRAVRKGMRLATSDPSGTAYRSFLGFPIAVGGKTGTGENAPKADNAMFMAYAPADGNSEPEIVVVALIEQGGHGNSVAAPVVRRVLEAYFGLTAGGTGSVPGTE